MVAEQNTGHHLDTPCASCGEPNVLTIAGISLCDHHAELLRGFFRWDIATPYQEQMVYFAAVKAPTLEDPHLGLVKIGTTWDVASRMRSLRCRAIATQQGDRVTEKRYHRAFADERADGEWFQLSPRLIQHMRSMARRRTNDWLIDLRTLLT